MTQQLLVSTRKGLFVLARNNRTWEVQQTAFLGENVTLTTPTANRVWYAALNLGHFGVKLKRSTDGGSSWDECPVPVYPEGEQVKTGDGKPPAPANLKMIWSLEDGGADNPQRLWAGTLPGGLFRSDDAAQSWHLVRGLWDRPERSHWFGGGYDVPGIHSICVHPHNSRRLSIGISCGGVWHSEDAGESWCVGGKGLVAAYMPPEMRHEPNIQDPHRLVQCPGAPDQLWIQHHNGIFQTSDGGQVWSEVAQAGPSVFGFAVAVHPKQPETAWFVPAIKDEQRVPVGGRLVVTRTRDRGQTFDTLHNGLPQAHAYDLVYRHSLAVDDSGEQLAFGSTTGGLWFSANQGDSWQMLPTRLPPVHAVRFA